MNIIDLCNIEFVNYNRNNLDVPGLLWHVISYEDDTGMGTYVLRYEPGAQTPTHTHMGYEEFLILRGSLFNSDGKVFEKNTFVSFEPKTTHYTFSPEGCDVLVFSRGENKVSQ